jgi:iron complex outermembrane recepter protein
MMGRIALRFLAALAATVAMGLTSFPAAAQEAKFRFELPSQPMEDSLRAIGRIAGVNVLFEPQAVRGRQAQAVNGQFTAVEAINQVLKDTALEVRATAPDSIVIKPRADDARPLPARSGAAPQGTMPQEKIVVSAQKRGSEFLQEVPIPVTVLNADVLVERNQLSLKDYFTSVPGLNFTGGNKNDAQLSIRGINGALNPTVGITVDDVPFGSSLFRSGGGLIPDLDPSDLARIEILRGPQGTLYGANSLGGLVRYVTVNPSTDRVGGYFQAGLASIEGGDELGYSLRGGVNVPLSGSLAVRASAFTRFDPGYIDNPAHDLKDVNSVDAYGGFASLMWRPSDALSIKLTALFQQKNADGVSRVDPALGDLRQTYVRGAGTARIKREAYSATVNGKWGHVDVTSITGYNANRYQDSIDIANAVRVAAANTNFGVAGAHYTEDYNAKKFSQELRALVPIGERLELLLGGFYTDEEFLFPTIEYAANPATGARVGTLAVFDGRGTYEEYAGFANLTLSVTDRFDIQVGGRKSRNSQEYSEIDTGVTQLVAGGRIVIPNTVIEEAPFTYLVTPRFRISPDLMVYARSASGYRAGGINPAFARGFPVPPGWKSDKTYTYEVGAKGILMDRALSFDASLFYIDWKDLQLNYTNAGFGYTSNGSRAKSQGIELSIEAHPLKGMTVATSMSYNQAELTESLGASTARGVAGDRLPFTSRLSGTASIDQRFPLAGEWVGFAGGSVAYVGDRVGVFTGLGAQRQVYPAYSQVDLRAGLEFRSWRLNAFVTNVGDKRGLVGGGIGQSNAKLFNIIQPRTIGVTVSKRF